MNSTGVSLSISPSTISVSANTLQPAPGSYFIVNALGLRNGGVVYFREQHSTTGISTVQNNSGNILPIAITVQFLAPAAIGPGTYDDQITISMCMDRACTQPVANSPQTIDVNYTVTKEVYALTGLSPASVDEQGSAFTLTVQGSNFTSQSVLRWNGASRTTHYVNSTELTADIPATDIAAPGTASVTVYDPAYQTTNAKTFTVIRPAMALNSISPTSVTVGGPSFTLTVLGDGFSAASTTLWNGTPLTTTYVSDKELLAQVPASDIGSLGTASITVNDATGTPGTAGPQSLAIAAISKDAVSYQMNSAHSGGVHFNNLNFPFPSTATWTKDVGGTPSYALIVQGMVILGVAPSGGSERLIALDQATGNTVWGPIALPSGSPANPIYDNGRLFILNEGGSSPSITAFDAGTGNQDWSTPIANSVNMLPSAGDGLVFVSGYAPDELYAFDESTGSQVWARSIRGGGFLRSPAVTADALYVGDSCVTYDIRPATGEIIWQQSPPSCAGGTGSSVAAANGLVYSADGMSTFDGDIYDAESGTNKGSYTAFPGLAFSTSMGFFLDSSRNLHGVTLSNNTSQWAFTGDGTLNTPPIVVNQYVFIGGYSPNLYAIDSTTGNVAWTVSLSTFVDGPGSGPLLSGLAAGDGLLVVSAGTKVSAYTLSTNP